MLKKIVLADLFVVALSPFLVFLSFTVGSFELLILVSGLLFILLLLNDVYIAISTKNFWRLLYLLMFVLILVLAVVVFGFWFDSAWGGSNDLTTQLLFLLLVVGMPLLGLICLVLRIFSNVKILRAIV